MSGHITVEERLEIESMIFQRCSFGEIPKKINKDRSTISREIRKHSVIEKSGYSGFGVNAWVHKETCKMGMVCVIEQWILPDKEIDIIEVKNKKNNILMSKTMVGKRVDCTVPLWYIQM